MESALFFAAAGGKGWVDRKFAPVEPAKRQVHNALQEDCTSSLRLFSALFVSLPDGYKVTMFSSKSNLNKINVFEFFSVV